MNKVLVISNNCFSKTDSNGRTLGNFFLGWDKSCLAQFYIQNSQPDFDYCENYFRVTDAQALSALKTGKCSGSAVEKPKEDPGNSAGQGASKSKRNALTMTARNLVWQSGRWKNCGFWQWVADFAPDIVLLQAGDCAFLFAIAVEMVKKTRAKLIIYNSEGYYYKKYDYFRARGLAHVLYPVFRRQFCRALERAYAMADCVIYNCDELRKQYALNFSGCSETVFTGSEIQYEKKATNDDVITTVYCGNLGLKRHEGLIEIADVLQTISPNLYVDVYGKIPNSEVEEALNQCKGIRYYGLIPYEKVKDLLRDSDILLHVESFDDFYQEDLRFAFSTKIADSLSSGNCFLLYAPEHFACYQYLKNNYAAYTVSNKDDLRTVLVSLVQNPAAREKYRAVALELAEKNHRAQKNNQKFQTILMK